MLSPLCTRGVRCPDGHTIFARVNTTGLFRGTGPGLHFGPCRCWLASTGAPRQTTHDAGDRNGSSGTLVDFAIFSSFSLANIVVIFLYKSNKTAYDIW